MFCMFYWLQNVQYNMVQWLSNVFICPPPSPSSHPQISYLLVTALIWGLAFFVLISLSVGPVSINTIKRESVHTHQQGVGLVVVGLVQGREMVHVVSQPTATSDMAVVTPYWGRSTADKSKSQKAKSEEIAVRRLLYSVPKTMKSFEETSAHTVMVHMVHMSWTYWTATNHTDRSHSFIKPCGTFELFALPTRHAKGLAFKHSLQINLFKDYSDSVGQIIMHSTPLGHIPNWTRCNYGNMSLVWLQKYTKTHAR